MHTIARSEFIQLFRNRLVLVTSIFVPIFFGGVLIATQENFGGTAVVAALISIVVISMGVYITLTTTLASRRQTLFLKRLRSTAVSDSSIVAGLVAPPIVINAIQLTAILIVLAALGESPTDPLLLIFALVMVVALFLGFALATSGLTNSPDHAQVTTLPLFLVGFGVAMWVGFTGTADLTLVKRLVPGGAATELIIESYQGIDLSEALLLALPTLAWIFVSFIVASQLFRWERRQ